MKRARSTRLIPRRRLQRLLSGNWKVAVLSAPAGYGKTVLAGQLMGGRDALFCRLRSEDARPAHLLGTILAAAESIRRPVGTHCRELFAVHRDFERDGGLLTAALVRELIPPRGTRWIVLDDLHAISNAPEALGWLRHLILETGPRVRFLLACRGECPLSLARFDLMGGSIVIKAADLAFDANEVSRFMGGLFPKPIAESRQSGLLAGLGGWPAGLALLSRIASRGPVPVQPSLQTVESEEQAKILDYLTQEVLAPLPSRLRRALYRASILEELDKALLRKLLGGRDADWLLSELKKHDLFLAPTGESVPRLQALFRDALRRELRRWEGAKEENRLLEIAASHWKKVGRASAAIGAQLEAGRPDLAAALLEAAAGETDVSHSAEFPHLALRILRTEKLGQGLASFPRLLVNAAHAAQRERQFDDAISYLRIARENFLLQGLTVEAAGAFRNEGTLSTMTGTARESLREGRTALRSLSEEAKVARGLFLLEMGQLELHLGRPARARACLRSAGLLLAGGGYDREVSQAAERQAEVYFTAGHWERYLAETLPALRYYQRAGFITRAQSLLINRAEALIYLGREEQARLTLDEAASIAERSMAPYLRAHEAIARARAASEMGSFGEAAALFRLARESVDRYGTPFAGFQLDLWEAVFERRRGKLVLAARGLQRAQDGFARSGSTAWESLARMEAGLVRGLQGDTDGAINALQQSLLTTRRHGDLKEEAANYLYRAAGLRRANRPCVDSLLASLRILEQEDYLVFLRKEARLVTPILREAIKRRPGSAILARAARTLPAGLKIDFATPRKAAARRQMRTRSGASLTIRLLGGFDLRHGAERRVLPRRACEILLAHLCLRRGPVSRETLAEAIWPGASADASRNRFDVALSAIRRVLEPEAGPRGPFRILSSQAGFCALSKGTVVVDVERFESAADRCEPWRRLLRVRSHSDPAPFRLKDARDAMRDLKAALELYGGELLSGRDLDPWLLTARERLEERRMGLRLALGQLAHTMGRMQDAITSAESMLADDPLCEPAIQIYLRSAIAEGRRDAALAAYRRFARLMERDLGVPPSPETQALVRRTLEANPGARTVIGR